MAWTVTVLKKSVHGDERVTHLHVAADSGSDTIDFGASYIYNIALTPASLTSTVPNARINVLTAATASPGMIAVTGLTSGDDFYVVAYHR